MSQVASLPSKFSRVSADNARNAAAAFDAAGLNWTVEQWPVYSTNGNARIVSETKVMNVRADNQTEMGVVGVGYQVVQNAEVAALIQELMEQEDTLTFDSLQEIDGGRRIIAKLQGHEFGPKLKQADIIVPQLLVSTGHDGGTAFEIQPSTFRLHCTNQLHLVAEARKGVAHVTLRHTRNISERVEAAKHVLATYRRSLDNTRELIAKLGDTAADKAFADKFFVENFNRDYFAIPAATGTLTKPEQKARERATVAYRAFCKHLAGETAKWGWNAWTVFNAYTATVQHDLPNMRQARTVAGRAKKAEQLAVNNMFGINMERTQRAFAAALTLAV